MADADSSEPVHQEPLPAGSTFAFDIPECSPGTIMKVSSPDGVELHIKRPANAYPFDSMHMVKAEDGRWGIKHVVRVGSAAMVDHATGNIQAKTKEEVAKDLVDVNVTKVVLQTTKGPLNIVVCPSWAPLGAMRFLQLANDGYFDDVAIYRGVPKFLVQFGVIQKERALEKFMVTKPTGEGFETIQVDKYEAIQDDSNIGVPILQGSICFAASGANTRKCTICIFLNDFPTLGKSPWETPIGQVHPDSLATLQKLHTGYGDIPQCGGSGPDPVKLEEEGSAYIKADFPNIDFVEKGTWDQ